MANSIGKFTFSPVGFIRCEYNSTDQIPKGLGAEHTADGILEIHPEFEEGLKDIEGFSHLFILWIFHESEGYELLGTPPTDTKPHGVFATRSPYRPNPIGLTVVELIRRDGRMLHLRGVDMLNNTPVLDVKPYLSSIPSEQIKRGWLAKAEKRKKSGPAAVKCAKR